MTSARVAWPGKNSPIFWVSCGMGQSWWERRRVVEDGGMGGVLVDLLGGEALEGEDRCILEIFD